MEEKIKIAIICRANSKWNTLYEILDDNKEELEYNTYDVSNPKWESKYRENNKGYCAYIYLATMPKFMDKPYIHLKASATEEDICNSIAKLFDELNGDNNEENVSKSDDIIRDDNIDRDNHGGSSICDSDCGKLNPEEHMDLPTDNLRNDSIQLLNGIVVNICNKKVILNKDDACKLKELIEFAKENNYEIIDVITSD